MEHTRAVNTAQKRSGGDGILGDNALRVPAAVRVDVINGGVER
jgi:hypothetical protein